MPKYKTLAEVKLAYDSGELDRNEDILILDNDTADLYKDDECVWRGYGPYEIAAEALAILNIPMDGA